MSEAPSDLIFKNHVTAPESNAETPGWSDAERCEYLPDLWRDVAGQVIAHERQGMRAHVARKTDELKGELKGSLDSLRCEFSTRLELLRECEAIRAAAADAERKQRDVETELLRRELAILRGEVGVDRRLKELCHEISVAQSTIPKMPTVVKRFDARQTELEAEQARLECELIATKDKLGKLRVAPSISDHTLAEHIRQKPESAVELRFETSDSSFQVRDMDPRAAEAWRDFVVGLMATPQDATLSISDSASTVNRVIPLPVRGSNAV